MHCPVDYSRGWDQYYDGPPTEGLQNVDQGWRHRNANHPRLTRTGKTTPVKQSATRGFGKPPFLPNSAVAISHAFNANEMSRDVARYRLADGLLGSSFISSRFLAPGLIAVVLLAVVLHKVRVSIVLGASALRTNQRVHAGWLTLIIRCRASLLGSWCWIPRVRISCALSIEDWDYWSWPVRSYA